MIILLPCFLITEFIGTRHYNILYYISFIEKIYTKICFPSHTSDMLVAFTTEMLPMASDDSCGVNIHRDLFQPGPEMLLSPQWR